MAQFIASRLMRDGHVKRSYIGIGGQNVPLHRRLVRFYDLPVESGLMVTRVEADNPWSRVTVADLEKVRAALRGGNHQVSDQGNMWAGFVVANILDIDAGEGLKGALLTPEQKRNRSDIKLYLARWAREKQLFIIKGERSAGGRRSPCYTSIEPTEDQDND